MGRRTGALTPRSADAPVRRRCPQAAAAAAEAAEVARVTCVQDVNLRRCLRVSDNGVRSIVCFTRMHRLQLDYCVRITVRFAMLTSPRFSFATRHSSRVRPQASDFAFKLCGAVQFRAFIGIC